MKFRGQLGGVDCLLYLWVLETELSSSTMVESALTLGVILLAILGVFSFFISSFLKLVFLEFHVIRFEHIHPPFQSLPNPLFLSYPLNVLYPLFFLTQQM